MFSSLPRAADDDRISAVAALTALGGHALAMAAALWLAGHARQTPLPQGAVSVTLVTASGGGQSPTPRHSVTPPSNANAASRAQIPAPSGERLDQLMALASPDAPPQAPSSAASSKASTPSGSPAGPSTAGSSLANQGLGAEEGAEGVDLYAGASLPQVGARPAASAGSDLWSRVAPCWRAASPRAVILLVELRGDGRLAAPPTAVRKAAKPADPPTLLAERAAFRALQACAPYEGLGERRWRVSFP